MKVLSFLIINLVWISYLIFQSVNGEMFTGPELQLCIVYYDDHKAIVKHPNEYEDGPCTLSNSINVINIFVANGYKMTEESRMEIEDPNKVFGYDNIILLKP